MDFSTIFRSQQAFFRSQQTKDIGFRKQNLERLKQLLQANEEKLYAAIYADFRKSRFETYATELSLVYAEIDYFLKHLLRLTQPKRVRTSLFNLPGKSRIYSEPLGCTLVIGAWNYPYNLTLLPVVSAMAAGNTCMIKPSELPERTMKAMADLINDHFPAEYLYVVQGEVEETTAILQLPFDKIFFTGSTKVGKIVYEAAAKNLTPVTLELGGKSPVIVTQHANLAVAAKRIVWGKFLNGGQTCIATDYILVHEHVKEQLVQLIRERLDKARYEADSEHYVRIINERNFKRLLALIDPQKVIYGGGTDETKLFIQPTILYNVTWNDAVMQEEIFGPLLPILPFRHLEEALETVLDHNKPLAAYLFSNDASEQQLFTDRISFGGGCINDTVMHIAGETLPFGGVGHSGMGNYHGDAGFYKFSHRKSVLKKATWGEPDWKYPPYDAKKLKWLKRLL